MLRIQNKESKEIHRLNELVKLKEREIIEIKTECAEQFKRIFKLCFINNYGDKYLNLKKIHEIASDNYSALFKDLEIAAGIVTEEQNNKVIELPNTHKNR